MKTAREIRRSKDILDFNSHRSSNVIAAIEEKREQKLKHAFELKDEEDKQKQLRRPFYKNARDYVITNIKDASVPKKKTETVIKEESTIIEPVKPKVNEFESIKKLYTKMFDQLYTKKNKKKKL